MSMQDDPDLALCVASHVRADLLEDFVPPVQWRRLAEALDELRRRNAVEPPTTPTLHIVPKTQVPPPTEI